MRKPNKKLVKLAKLKIRTSKTVMLTLAKLSIVVLLFARLKFKVIISAIIQEPTVAQQNINIITELN